MEAPKLIKAIPNQGVNERAAYGPFDLSEFIQTADGSDIHFEAEIQDGASLPKGLICTYDGLVTGIPAKGTSGNYEVTINASNEAGSIKTQFNLSIQPTMASKDTQEFGDELKQKIWEAIESNQPIPDLTELLGRDVTPGDIYYLLERWASLTIYDAYNLEPPGEKKLIDLPGISKYFEAFDRGCCLVARPKDLFSHERTLADAIQTAQALAREAVRRDWVVELVGFNKLTRAAWVEIQHLGETMNKKFDVLNFEPTTSDVKLYQERSREGTMTRNIE